MAQQNSIEEYVDTINISINISIYTYRDIEYILIHFNEYVSNITY